MSSILYAEIYLICLLVVSSDSGDRTILNQDVLALKMKSGRGVVNADCFEKKFHVRGI